MSEKIGDGLYPPGCYTEKDTVIGFRSRSTKPKYITLEDENYSINVMETIKDTTSMIANINKTVTDINEIVINMQKQLKKMEK
jgi:hypothetical protein